MFVHIGLFENFKGANTILICGDGGGLQWLTDHLRSLEDAAERGSKDGALL